MFQLSQENTSRFQKLIARIPMNYMVLSEKIIQIAEEKLGKKLDKSIYFNVKFFAQRLMLGTYYEDNDSELLDMVRSKYPQAYACTRKIADYIAQTRGQHLGEEEELYLTVHIARVTRQ